MTGKERIEGAQSLSQALKFAKPTNVTVAFLTRVARGSAEAVAAAAMTIASSMGGAAGGCGALLRCRLRRTSVDSEAVLCSIHLTKCRELAPFC